MNHPLVRIHAHQIDANAIHLLSGELEFRISNAERSRIALETNLGRVPTDEENTFEFFWPLLEQIREGYPCLIALLGTFDTTNQANGMPPSDILERYDWLRVPQSVGLMADGDLHLFSENECTGFLINFGRDDPLVLSRYFRELSRYHVVFLFSKSDLGLDAALRALTSFGDVSKIRANLLATFDVYFAVPEDTGFILATKDPAIVHAIEKA